MPSLWSLRQCAALLAMVWASQVTHAHTSEICKPAPHWDVQGRAPMEEHLGNVVVVALLKAS